MRNAEFIGQNRCAPSRFEPGPDIPHSAFRIPHSLRGNRMLALLSALSLAFQSQVADTSPFRPLALPTPSRVRSASGGPGPEYWQQRADYVIRATLDTAMQTIRGTERIHYVNHSPDTLKFVWVQIEQNIFAPNRTTYVLNQP